MEIHTGPIGDILESAAAFVETTSSRFVYPAHMLLALLADPHLISVSLFQHRFGKLKPSTLADSLDDILRIEMEMGTAPAASEHLVESSNAGIAALASDSLCLLQKIEEQPASDPQTIKRRLASLIFQNPDRFISMAFQDAGIPGERLMEFGTDLWSADCVASIPDLFLDDHLNFSAFGPLTQEVMAGLATLKEHDAHRKIGDIDLLSGFMHQDHSMTVGALHLSGIDVGRLRTYLTKLSGEFPVRPSRLPLPKSRLTRLLQGILIEAGSLAAREYASVITESHLLRTHLQRIGQSAGNIYERLGIHTLHLYNWLEKQKAEMAVSSATNGPSPIDIENMEEYLYQHVIGQEEAIQAVLPALRRMRTGLNEPGRLLGTFLFLGATGTGKTELAKATAQVVFGTQPNETDSYLIKIDCGNFKEPEDIVQLLGARQGLVGYKEGQLTNGLRIKPKAILLFDEAEKAHRQIWQSLLPLFDEGVVREADGTRYDATNCILIATSNLGYEVAINQLDLFSAGKQVWKEKQAELRQLVWNSVEHYFSPEFRGRFGRENILYFNHFDREDYSRIFRLQIDALIGEMKGRGMEVMVEDSVYEVLAGMALARREEGARPIRRLVTKYLRDPIVNARISEPSRTVFNFIGLPSRVEVVLREN